MSWFSIISVSFYLVKMGFIKRKFYLYFAKFKCCLIRDENLLRFQDFLDICFSFLIFSIYFLNIYIVYACFLFFISSIYFLNRFAIINWINLITYSFPIFKNLYCYCLFQNSNTQNISKSIYWWSFAVLTKFCK